MAILVQRDHIGIFGKMNVGKSSIMNLLTQQKTSIVDGTPGTTADTKIALKEIHGIGPLKFFDTAGVDEKGDLGDKKREKIYADLKECDLILLVINPGNKNKELSYENDILDKARELDKQVIVVYNLFSPEDKENISVIEEDLNLLKFYKKLNIVVIDDSNRMKLINFILSNYEPKNIEIPLLPFIEKDEFYVLNIPMDAETPKGRYLRPQSMTEEYITRNFAYPVSYRMDLGAARNNDKEIVSKEKKRFEEFINNFKKRPKCIITDSQAMDIMNKWCPEDIKLTTFSIVMINYFSRGRLASFVDGIKPMKVLSKGDKILIVEACNHSRIEEDIGTVQIPNYFKREFPGIVIEHNFGREFYENSRLTEYKFIIHCGGCMISSQKLLARIRDLDSINVPYTNYGIMLSYIQGEEALNKVLEVWK